ncbi:hypothetical protein [Streptomyces prasinopilosus]|uniref:hypothetical protein n=1 Tax=Streptomyces prasinopilosus TaxID=67344 RepID=UPI0006EB6BB9|nr:hypothetical protein [Streptomyces prasinopilosus]
MHRIVIDQSKIRLDQDLARRGAPGFPRSLKWWQRNTPGFTDATILDDDRIALTINDKLPNGQRIELTPAIIRRRMNALRTALDNRMFLDFSDAIVEA